MFQTKKGKFVALAILIIILVTGALCAFSLFTDRSANPDSSETDAQAGYSGEDTRPTLTPPPAAKNLTAAPTATPQPTDVPPPAAEDLTAAPTGTPQPTDVPADTPTPATEDPTAATTATPQPTDVPTPAAENPTAAPTDTPQPTDVPADTPTPAAEDPTAAPTDTPPPAAKNLTAAPTATPQPTDVPTLTPTPAVKNPTAAPTDTPQPTMVPTAVPSTSKSGMDGSVSANGQLRVNGTQLVNAGGSPIVLRGVSTHGIAWFPDFSTKPFMQTLQAEWGATVFRIAMYSYEGSDSYVNNPAWNKAKVCGLIDAAIELDMYVIVDWHILADGNPQTYRKQAAEFFTYIASTYPGVPNLLYEICNEPNGGVSWSGNIKPYADEIIPVIRQYSPDAIILVGTPTWSQDVDAAATDPLDFDNVMYTLHFYAGTHKEWLRNKADTALTKGLALFVTEWGTTDASGNGTVDKTSSDEWLTYLEKNQISWCNWSLCNKSESSALLLPSAPSSGAMPDSSLSESGKYVKKKMLEYSGTTPVEREAQDSTGTPGQKPTPTPATAATGDGSAVGGTESTSGQKPPAVSNTGLTLLYYNENREASTNTISPRFQIKNNTENDIPLDTLTILYYYTPEKEITQCFFCDYAEVNGRNYRAITSEINAVFIAGSGSCMQITFSSGAGILAAGDTATLQMRIANEDWSNYTQSNDASFSPDTTSYTENDHAVLISK